MQNVVSLKFGDVVAHLIFYYRKSDTIRTADAYEYSAMFGLENRRHNNEIQALINTVDNKGDIAKQGTMGTQEVYSSVADPDPHGSGTFAWIRIRIIVPDPAKNERADR